MERQFYKCLISDSGLSQSTLQRLFNEYLKSPPKNLIKSKSNVHLLIDATYFNNGLCLVLYYDYDIQYVQLFRETNNEKYKEIKEDLENLNELVVDFCSVTCDGHRTTLKAVSKIYPNAVIQRCIVHVKRQIKIYLSSNPKLTQSIELLTISQEIMRIKTIEQASEWIHKTNNWYKTNQHIIGEKVYNEDTKRWWYKHKSLYQA